MDVVAAPRTGKREVGDGTPYKRSFFDGMEASSSSAPATINRMNTRPTAKIAAAATNTQRKMPAKSACAKAKPLVSPNGF